MDRIEWPKKTREYQTAAIDSTYWNGFAFRDDDIIIGTYAKAGTTWVQQIVAQLIFNGEEGLPVAQMSPWLDFRLPPLEEKLPGIEAQDIGVSSRLIYRWMRSCSLRRQNTSTSPAMVVTLCGAFSTITTT